jgi:oligopeptide transport system ATP-binding protein
MTTTNGSKQRGDVLVKIQDLKMYFPITRGIIFQRRVGDIKAVDGISFDIRRGETLGLVGRAAAVKARPAGPSCNCTARPMVRSSLRARS